MREYEARLADSLREAAIILARSVCFRKQLTAPKTFVSQGLYDFSDACDRGFDPLISPSRQAAHSILEQVAAGAFATDLLLEKTASLPSRDAGLASQIVFGCLRFQSQLDFLIQHFSTRSPASLDLPVLIALRSAIYQMRYLDRIPPHAAVHDAVEYAKRRQRAASGLVNAVLRKVHRNPIPWPDEATELSCPPWLLARWSRHFGPAASRALASAALHEPGHYIRIPAGTPVPPELSVEPAGPPGCYRVLSGANAIPNLRFQDIGSQEVVPWLDLAPGLSFLDLCAAPGNKTVQALETPLSFAIACDVSLRRISQVPPVCPRVVLDAAQPLPFRPQFDRILVDAPCSGTGTLARNPEIKWRVHASDFARFQQKQIGILRQAARVLAPGGKLLYATCSLEPEENESVVSAILAEHPDLELVGRHLRLPGELPGDGFQGALLQSRSPRG